MKRLLTIDDDSHFFGLIISAIATPISFSCQHARTFASFKEMLTEDVSVIMVDLMMPGMDGWEVCRLLRESGYSDLPIVVVSANVFDPTARQSDSMYCNDFIAKPFMLAELLSKLKLHLGIEWISAKASEAKAPQPLRLIPPRTTLTRLSELGAIGFVKGIHAELDRIEKENLLYAPFCNELRSLIDRFRLPEYTHRLKEWMHDDVDHL